MKYMELSARECARRMRRDELDPVEYMQAHLDCITEKNKTINALRYTDEAAALQTAKALRKNKSNGRLAGLVFSAKDHIDVAGLPQSLGTLRGAVGSVGHNAACIQQLLDEGAICVGKTNMPEMARSYSTDNKDFGRTNNPHNEDYSPGGSSGGDSAAVASGMVDFSIGADSSGSLRVPANFCGVFTLYPTLGTVSHAGLTSYAHTTSALFRSVGPICRTLDDLELVYEVMRSFDPKDPLSTPMPYAEMLESMPINERNLKGKYLWFSKLGEVDAQSEIRATLVEAGTRLNALGIKGIEHTPELFVKCLEPYVILGIQTSLAVDDMLGITSPGNESDNMAYLRQALKEKVPELSVENVLKSWHAVDTLRQHVHALFEEVDFIVSPVAATPATPHGTTEYNIDGNVHETQNVFLYASIANILGLPAVAFPTHKNKDGIPIGLQIMGPRFSDRLLLQAVRDMGYTHCL